MLYVIRVSASVSMVSTPEKMSSKSEISNSDEFHPWTVLLVGSTALATKLMVGFSMEAGIEFLHSLQHLMTTISSDPSLHTIFFSQPPYPPPPLKP